MSYLPDRADKNIMLYFLSDLSSMPYVMEVRKNVNTSLEEVSRVFNEIMQI